MRAKDFPFVDDALTSRAATLRDFLTSDAPRGDARARLREELVRWHPDKFQNRHGPRLAPGTAEETLVRVSEVAQRINSAWADFAGS